MSEGRRTPPRCRSLDNPTVSPSGNPIPGLSLLGLNKRRPGSGCGSGSTAVADRWPRPVTVRQLTEHVQGDAALIGRLKETGVVPNARVLVETRADGSVTIMIAGHDSVDLPITAHAVKVEKV